MDAQAPSRDRTKPEQNDISIGKCVLPVTVTGIIFDC